MSGTGAPGSIGWDANARRRARVPLAIVAVLAVCGTLVVVPAAPMAAQDDPAPACVDGFEQTRRVVDVLPEGIVAAGPGPAWAVGGRLLENGLRQAAIMRFDGTEWQDVPAPAEHRSQAYSDTAYMGLGGSGSSGVWAVGYGRTPSSARALAAKRGDRWRSVDVPVPSTGGSYLSDVGGVPRHGT